MERLARRAADRPWRPSMPWCSDDPVPRLLRLVTGRPGGRRTRRARAAIEALWASGPVQRESIWTSIWHLWPGGFANRFTAADVPRAFVEFLVGRDPVAAHEPRVRLVTGMSFTNTFLSMRPSPVDLILAGATDSGDPRTRADLSDVLSRTDQPAFLAVLQDRFVTGLRERVRHGRYSDDGLWTREEHRHYSDEWPWTRERLGRRLSDEPWARERRRRYPDNGLWAYDEHGPYVDDGFWTRKKPAEPTALLHIIVANHHLPTASTADTADADQLAVLLALQGRTGKVAVTSLLDHAGYNWLPPTVIAACRLTLASLPPGGWREELCERAISTGDEKIVALVVKAGYRPADRGTVPLFLAATRQWPALEYTDPDLRTLERYCRRTAFVPQGPAIRTVDALMRVVDDAPPAIGSTIRRIVGDTVTRRVRNRLCDLASDGHPAAIRTVVDTGIVPQAKDLRVPFLFLTGQWDRYDAADPDGSRLRAYTRKLGAGDHRRDRFRHVATAAGRPLPCEAARTHTNPSYASGRYRPSGSAYSGTGGYGTGISVHGV